MMLMSTRLLSRSLPRRKGDASSHPAVTCLEDDLESRYNMFCAQQSNEKHTVCEVTAIGLGYHSELVPIHCRNEIAQRVVTSLLCDSDLDHAFPE